MNLYEKISDWIIDYTPLANWIYFNSTPITVGAVSMNSVPGESILKKFIDGRTERQILFAIEMVKEYDLAGTSSINLDAFEEVTNFAEWINHQKELGNYPDFGNDNIIEDIDVVTNVPTMLLDTQNSLARYQFQVKIIYKNESEVIRNG